MWWVNISVRQNWWENWIHSSHILHLGLFVSGKVFMSCSFIHFDSQDSCFVIYCTYILSYIDLFHLLKEISFCVPLSYHMLGLIRYIWGIIQIYLLTLLKPITFFASLLFLFLQRIRSTNSRIYFRYIQHCSKYIKNTCNMHLIFLRSTSRGIYFRYISQRSNLYIPGIYFYGTLFAPNLYPTCTPLVENIP